MFDYSGNELQTIDQQLDPILGYAQTKVAETQQLAFDATRLLSCTEDRFDDYRGQGFFRRCWSALYGKTGEMQRANQKDLILMQKYSWRYINLLQERDLLLGHSLLAVRNNLLTLAIDEEETRNEITRMAGKILARFQDLEDRMKNVEAAVTIHNWLLTIATRDYDEKYSPHFRLLRVIKDFLSLKDTDWNINEIKCIQKALIDVGLPWKREITLSEFIDELIEEIECSTFSVYQDLLFIASGQSGGFIPESFIIENIAVPGFNSLFNLAGNYSGASTTIDILCDHLNVSRKDALKKVLFECILKQGINLEISLPLRDLTVELLSCMRLSQNLYDAFQQGTLLDPLNESSEIDNRIPVNKVPSDNTKLMSLLKLAEQGNQDAQYNLGALYEYGDVDTKMNDEVALNWFLKAAEQGHVKAQSKLAELFWYRQVLEEEPDYREAFKWAKLAAESDDAHAQYLLANMYEEGEGGVKEDKVQAFHWYKSASSQGHVDAMFSLGLIYRFGDVVPRNLTEAFELINNSCSNSGYYKPNISHLASLASMHLLGLGTKQSYSKAKEIILEMKEMIKSEDDIYEKDDLIGNILSDAGDLFEDSEYFYPLAFVDCLVDDESFDSFFESLRDNEDIKNSIGGFIYWEGKRNGFVISEKMIYWLSNGEKRNAPFEWEGFKAPLLSDKGEIIFDNSNNLSVASSHLAEDKKLILIDLIKSLHAISV